MPDPGRCVHLERPESADLLSLGQALLHPFPFRDVEDGSDCADRVASVPFAFKKRLRAGDQPPDFAVSANDTLLPIKLAVASRIVDAADRGGNPLPVLRMQHGDGII